MEYVFAFFAGLFITIVAVPPLWRMAGVLHLIDQPSQRKIHDSPVPRIGGIAIAVAVGVAAVTWVPLDATLSVYLLCAWWIIVFGVIDDAWTLSAKWKLAAQIPPVLSIVHAGVIMHHLPFFGLDSAPFWLAVPVTIIFILGITNAVNLFDGLDGLAGGCMMLSLAAIAYLSSVVGGASLALLCIIIMGGILGFLNFNTYPARIFLGDGGSQFLGFSVAVFSILLTESVHTALNPAIPFILLGLPLLDTTWVFFLRLSQGKSPFEPDRQHIHHQLLDSGIGHAGAVSSIYLFQALLIGTAILVPYASDWTLVGLLILNWAGLLALILYGQRRARKLAAIGGGAIKTNRPWSWFDENFRDAIRKTANYLIEGGLSAFLVATFYTDVPFGRDVAIVAGGIAVLMIFAALFMRQWTGLFTRIGFYAACGLAVYSYEPKFSSSDVIAWALTIYFAALAVVLGGAIAVTRREVFQVSPQDLLIGFVALAAAALRPNFLSGVDVGFVAIATAILFYACEYLVSITQHQYLALRITAVVALVIFAVRGMNI